MTVKELMDVSIFKLLNAGNDLERNISAPYCCDLLSIAMGSAPADCIWFTVMANMNTMAVATLTDAACIVFAHDAAPDEATLSKAKSEGITLFQTELPIFDAALLAYQILNE